MTRIVIIGAGFGGLQAVEALARAAVPADILLLDRHNYHTFAPLLYQVATAALEAEEIAYPVRAFLRRFPSVRFKVREATGIDLDRRTVQTNLGEEAYDYLVLAAGSTTNFFGLPGVAGNSLTLKDLPDAIAIRNRLVALFERATEETDPQLREALLTIVIVGGGPTGVELAGAFAELAREILLRDFPSLHANEATVMLLEASGRLLSAFRPRLSQSALSTLRRKNVEVRLRTEVERVDADVVVLSGGTQVRTSLLVWAAGVRASDLGGTLGTALGRAGRVPVLPTLQMRDHPNVYVIGDMAELRDGNDVLPMLAPVAMQGGRAAGQNIALQIGGRQPRRFRYRDRGTMATLGRAAAIAQVGPLSLTGFPAWVAWLGLHLIELIGFRNRMLVLVNWAWDYVALERGARVIIGGKDGD